MGMLLFQIKIIGDFSLIDYGTEEAGDFMDVPILNGDGKCLESYKLKNVH